ncbi:MAG: hypothetical protein HC837_00535 [Chloroflexaceae bacterium]|nr:hypothetical protein [Chloroflexaceae bacterium]
MILFQLPLSLRLSIEQAPEATVGPPLAAPEQPATPRERTRLPIRIWLFALVTFLYGLCEGIYGNWTTIYLEKDAGLSTVEAAYGLAVFWAMVTLGRAIFALAAIWFRPQVLYLFSLCAGSDLCCFAHGHWSGQLDARVRPCWPGMFFLFPAFDQHGLGRATRGAGCRFGHARRWD